MGQQRILLCLAVLSLAVTPSHACSAPRPRSEPLGCPLPKSLLFSDQHDAPLLLMHRAPEA